MRVEVINTGSELLLGLVTNTHLGFLAGELAALGLRISRQTTLPDGHAIETVLAEVAHTADLIFVTGGLGPTNDDLTRDAAASAFGCKLHLDENILEGLTRRFAERGIAIDDHIARQAMVPEGAEVLPNPHGTAPGLYFPPKGGEHRRPAVFLLPGPPRELHPMVRDHVLPRLRGLVTTPPPTMQTLKLTGIGESQVEAAVGDRIEALPALEVGYCARQGEVDVRLIGSREVVEEARQIILEALGPFVFSLSGESLEEVVVSLLKQRGASLSVAESCTGGLLSHRITNVPGASEVFLAGLTTYANQAKEAFADVPADLLARHGAVSAEVAAAMACGVRARTGSTYALATTGIAGPGGGSAVKPIGTVFLGFAADDGHATACHRLFRSDRESFKHLATQAALDILRRHLAGLPPLNCGKP